MSGYTLVHGEALTALSGMGEASIDACCTDPPYGLRFMGKRWDYEIPPVALWQQVFRVLKPGARLLCFAGSRTMHRMWCNIEDAGFTIEDTIMWLYGSGFPKHSSKLKPAFEPICCARKGGVSELNIDACRIGLGGERAPSGSGDRRNGSKYAQDEWTRTKMANGGNVTPPSGRWPANIVLDEEAGAALDEQSGEVGGGPLHSRYGETPSTGAIYGAFGERSLAQHADSGGASRFFYTAKASRSEREHGLEGATQKPGGSNAKGFTDDVANGQDRNRPVANNHPTVKPVDLMRWLCRLVSPPGGLVLDPFMGSGTTGVAATLEGFGFIGIERESEYVEIARQRIANTQPSLFGAA